MWLSRSFKKWYSYIHVREASAQLHEAWRWAHVLGCFKFTLCTTMNMSSWALWMGLWVVCDIYVSPWANSWKRSGTMIFLQHTYCNSILQLTVHACYSIICVRVDHTCYRPYLQASLELSYITKKWDNSEMESSYVVYVYSMILIWKQTINSFPAKF